MNPLKRHRTSHLICLSLFTLGARYQELLNAQTYFTIEKGSKDRGNVNKQREQSNPSGSTFRNCFLHTLK